MRRRLRFKVVTIVASVMLLACVHRPLGQPPPSAVAQIADAGIRLLQVVDAIQDAIIAIDRAGLAPASETVPAMRISLQLGLDAKALAVALRKSTRRRTPAAARRSSRTPRHY